MLQQDQDKLNAAIAAVAFVKAHDVVGLGTGSTAVFAIKELAKLVKEGLQVTGVPSSEHTKQLAQSLGIPLLPLGEVGAIDISIDGADEFTERLQLIKGGGGALFREKIVASLSRNSIIITDASKRVEKLGAFKVPIEVVPHAYRYVANQLEKLGGLVVQRMKNGDVLITDNQNYIVDVDFGLIDHPEQLSIAINQIDGVLAHGIFVDLTAKVIMSTAGNIEVFGG